MLNDDEFARLKNFSTNFVIIMMSAFDEAIEKLGEVFGEIGAAMTEAFGGDGDEVREGVRKNLTPDVLKSVRESRDSITVNEEELADARANCPPEQLVKLDKILSSKSVGLPRLDTELSDEDLAGYIALSRADNENANDLFDELQGWMGETQAMAGGEAPPNSVDDEELARIKEGVDGLFEKIGAGDSALPADLLKPMMGPDADHHELADLLSFMVEAGGDTTTPVTRDGVLEQIMKFNPSKKLKLTESQHELVLSIMFDPEWNELSGGKGHIELSAMADLYSEDELKAIDTKGDGVIDRDELLAHWKRESLAADIFDWK